MDADPVSVRSACEAGVDESIGNALQPAFVGDEEMVSFNLILHHPVADTDAHTLAICRIARSRALSTIGRALGCVVPAMRANSFGVGVRFRSHGKWEREVFAPAGWCVVRRLRGPEEVVSWLWRILLIKSIHRDSFLLEPGVVVATPAPPAA